MLTVGPVDPSLYPNSPRSLKSQWVLYASQLLDPIEVIEIDGTFLLSLGAHSSHVNYLFATKRKPTLNEICLIESAITYCFDCPCALINPRFPKESNQLRKGYRPYYKKFHGSIVEEMYNPFHGQDEIIDIASQNGLDSFARHLDSITPGESRWKLKLPTKASVKNAMFVYRLAALSLDPFSRILNYWRCLESLTSINERKALFADVPNLSPAPVYVMDRPNAKKRFNIMKKYCNEAKLHFNDLVKTLRSANDINDYFYKQRRCPVAHANGTPLSYDSGVSYGEFARDCIMLKVVVRSAMEAKM